MNINKEEYLQNLQASLKIVQSNVNDYFAKDGNENKTMDDYFESDDFYAIIDAVNIDWNGIEVSKNKTINTTTDLINWIKEIATSIPEQGSSQEELGKDGKSAYEIAKENGFEGTEEEWLESLKGVDGERGVDGKSAYELYKETVIEQETKPAIYSFESFGVDDQTPYGTGTVKVIEIDTVEDTTTIEVLTNEPAGNTTPEQAQQFIGKHFIIHNKELINGNQYYLYSDSGLLTPICVTVELVREAQEPVVMTETEWLESLKGKDGSFDESALENYATTEYVDQKISDLVNDAPPALDTLKEIADILNGTTVDDEPVKGIIEKLDQVISDYKKLKEIVGDLGGAVEYSTPTDGDFDKIMSKSGIIKVLENMNVKTYTGSATSKNITTLKLNGKTLTTTANTTTNPSIMARYKQQITITGGGTINANGHIAIEANGEDVVINLGGTMFGRPTYITDRSGGELIYCYLGTINITEGIFKNTGEDKTFMLNCYDQNYANGKAKIIVTGGKFYDFDPANNTAEGENTSFVPEGYESVESTVIEDDVEHKVYTVKKINN